MTVAKLAVLGSGAVARAVGPRLREAGYGVACWARTGAEQVGVSITLEEVQHFDVAWLLVSDRAIAEVSARLVEACAPPIVLHASGFFGTEVVGAADDAPPATPPVAAACAYLSVPNDWRYLWNPTTADGLARLRVA